jgi:hypothetical protein
MKLNIEINIDDKMISDVAMKVVMAKVNDRASSWVTENSFTDAVKAGWDRGLRAMVDSAIAESDTVRKKIGEEMHRQIKNKLAAAIRASGTDGAKGV